MIKTLKEWTFDHYHYIFGIDDLAAATIISGIVAAVASIGSSAMQNKANSDAVASTNEQNKELTERAWARDDMQLQRARQDAEKAGFSPLAALSSNLTNSSPATMQAPVYDYSGISKGVSALGDTPRNALLAKQQSKMMHEELRQAKAQNRSMMLDNMLKSANFRNNVLKNGAETMKLLKELRGMDLTNAQTASILVANGFTQEQAEKLSGIANIPAHTGEVAAEANTKASTGLMNAQASLAYAQITDLNSMRQYHQDLLRWQAQVSHLQADKDAKLNHYWYDTLPKDSPSISFKKMNMKTGKLEDDFISTAGRSRFEAMEEYERKYAQLQTDIQKYASEHNTPMEWMNSIWGNINGTVNAASSFFMPSTTTYQSFEYNRQGRVTGSTTQQTRSSGFGR